jgi:hypothetical protein
VIKSKKPKAKSKAASRNERLRPSELGGLVLDHMRQHKDALPLTASAIGKRIGRSRGAVANCLARYWLPKAS